MYKFILKYLIITIVFGGSLSILLLNSSQGGALAACPEGYRQNSEPYVRTSDPFNSGLRFCRELETLPNTVYTGFNGTFCQFCDYIGCPSGKVPVLNSPTDKYYTCTALSSCNIGAVACTDPGLTGGRERCNNAREWLPYTSCNSGEICTGNGVCSTPSCPAGATWNTAQNSCVCAATNAAPINGICGGNIPNCPSGWSPHFTGIPPNEVYTGACRTTCSCPAGYTNSTFSYSSQIAPYSCPADPVGGGYCGSPVGPVCVPACQNGGTCVGTNSCSCINGYTGSYCQSTACYCNDYSYLGYSGGSFNIPAGNSCASYLSSYCSYTPPTTVCSCPSGYTSTPPSYTGTYTISAGTCAGTVSSRCYAPCPAKPTNSSWNAGNGAYSPSCAYTCSAGLSGANCDVCTNGANPAACTICPAGKIMYSGTCTDPTPLAPTATVWAKVVIATTTAAKSNPMDPSAKPLAGISIATVNYGSHTTDATGRISFAANAATGFSIRPNMSAYTSKGVTEATYSLSNPKTTNYESQIPNYDCKVSGPTDTDVLRKYFCYDKYSGNATYQTDIKALDSTGDSGYLIVFIPNAPQISAPSQSIAYNSPATLTWVGNSTAGTVISNWSLSCPGLPTQTGTSASGTYTTPNLTANKTCTLTGNDEWGQAFSTSITITVGTASAPVLTSLLVSTPYSTTPSANSWTKAGDRANTLVLTGTGIYPNTVCTVTLTNGSGSSTYVIDNATTPNGASGDEFSGNTYSWPASSLASFGSDTTWSVICNTAGQNSNTVSANLLVIQPATLITTGPTVNTVPLSGTCPAHTDYYKLYRTIPTLKTQLAAAAFTANPVLYTATGLSNNAAYSYQLDCLMGGSSGTIIETATVSTATTNCTNVGETYNSISGQCECPAYQSVQSSVCKWDQAILTIGVTPSPVTVAPTQSQAFTVSSMPGWICGIYNIDNILVSNATSTLPMTAVGNQYKSSYLVPDNNIPDVQWQPKDPGVNYDYLYHAQCVSPTTDSSNEKYTLNSNIEVTVPNSSLSVNITSTSPIVTGIGSSAKVAFDTNGDVCYAYLGATEIVGTTFTALPTSNNAMTAATATLPTSFTSTSGTKNVKIECSRISDPSVKANDAIDINVAKDPTATIGSVYSGPYTNGNFITTYKCEDSSNWELYRRTTASPTWTSIASSTGNVSSSVNLHYAVPGTVPAPGTQYQIICRNASGIEKSATSPAFDIANAYPRMLRFDTVPDKVNNGTGEDKITINYQIVNPINCQITTTSGPAYTTSPTTTQEIMDSEVTSIQKKVISLFKTSANWDKLNYPSYISGIAANKTIENIAISYRKVFTLSCPKYNPSDPNNPIMDTRSYTTQIQGQSDQ